MLTLDVAGSTTLSPFSIGGTADLKALNATLLHGTAKFSDAGVYIEGAIGLNLQQIVRGSFPASIQGTGKIWMPIDGKSNYVIEASAPARSSRCRARSTW